MAMESRYSVFLPKRYYRVFSVVVLEFVSHSGENVSCDVIIKIISKKNAQSRDDLFEKMKRFFQFILCLFEK